MKELRRKTTFTLISILSLILIAVMVLLNVRTYANEKEGIRRNLDVLENKRGIREPEAGEYADVPDKPEGRRMKPRDMENVMRLFRPDERK